MARTSFTTPRFGSKSLFPWIQAYPDFMVKASDEYFFKYHAEAFAETLKTVGITPPKHALDGGRGWIRFMNYAMKRARSNHPHNIKWKPLLGTYIAMRVADKLES